MSERNAPAVDVAVIGAGAIGLAIAWRACARGLSVAVLERGRLGQGTSSVAAGMLAPTAEATPAEEPLLELGLESAARYPDFLRELAVAADTPELGYSRCGTLLLARDEDEAQALEREFALRRRYGLTVERLRASAARHLEPALVPGLRLALSIPDDHAIDPRRLTAALAAAVRRGGGALHEHAAVTGVNASGGRLNGVGLADGSQLQASAVVIAAGAWAPELEGLPEPVASALRPVKGQIMRLHDPAGPGLLRRVVRMGSSYIVPRGDGRYVIGATSEERGFDTTVTAGAGFELLRDASELVPGVSELVLDEFSAGLRPGSADNLPVIGPGSPPGLHWAVGHGRGGILLAPITAELVLDSLLGEGGPHPLAGMFAPGRFAPVAVVGSAAWS